MKYYQFDEDVIAVRSVIIEAKNKQEATEAFTQLEEDIFVYEVYESVGLQISEHLFKPLLN